MTTSDDITNSNRFLKASLFPRSIQQWFREIDIDSNIYICSEYGFSLQKNGCHHLSKAKRRPWLETEQTAPPAPEKHILRIVLSIYIRRTLNKHLPILFLLIWIRNTLKNTSRERFLLIYIRRLWKTHPEKLFCWYRFENPKTAKIRKINGVRCPA